ncbi:hypothetical protein AB0C07_29220 [Actinoplanes missouriensis]|uniref:hypothetical protein n=1 Tax=Actinoplanes missouriensis TaxID=1866 RepID=UPI0033C82F30
MTESVAAASRAAAQRLTGTYGPRLTADVEAALHATDGRPQQYTDPVAIGGLIVAVANFAWTVYWNLKQGSSQAQPQPHVIVRTIRLDLPASTDLGPDERNRIIEAVVDETIAVAAPLGEKPEE